MNKKFILFAVISVTLLAGLGFIFFASEETKLSTGDTDTASSTQIVENEDLATTSPAIASSTIVANATDTVATPVTFPPVSKPPVPIPTPVVKAPGITMTEVSTHNSDKSCWTAISGSVYDLTSFIHKHPGGASRILSICGKDGTDAFLSQHEGQSRPESLLASFRIDTLSQ